MKYFVASYFDIKQLDYLLHLQFEYNPLCLFSAQMTLHEKSIIAKTFTIREITPDVICLFWMLFFYFYTISYNVLL